jgi:hypothetical protein
MGCPRARSYFTAALGVSLSFATQAQASEPTPEERAGTLRDQAFAALSAGHYAEAADKFREAWELGRDFLDICNLGRAEMDLGRWREAAEHITSCVKVIPESQKPVFSERFERFQRQAYAKVGALSITANVPGADVFVDDKIVGKIPLNRLIFVDPGSHKVEVRAPGFEPATTSVDATAGSSLHLEMRLSETKPDGVSPPKREAETSLLLHLEVRRPVTKSDWVWAPLQDAGTSLREQPAPAPNAFVKEPPGRSGAAAQGPAQPKTAVLVVGSALGIVGTALGVGGLMAAQRAADDAEAMDEALGKTGVDVACWAPEYSAACDEQKATKAKIVPLQLLGVGGSALAGAGIALLISEVVRASSDNAKGGPNAALIVTPEGGALGLTGSF